MNDLRNPTDREQMFFQLGYKRGTEKVQSGLNLLALAFGAFLFILGLLLGSKCHAQTYDTIPCHLLYRTKAGQVGIVKGWEVRQRMPMHVFEGDRAYGKVITITTYLRPEKKRFPKGTEVWRLQDPIKIN